MAQSKNYYQILDIPSNASVQIIKRAIRNLRRQDHTADFSIIINNIEHVLTDAEQRAEYDKSIHLDPKDCINYEIMHQFIPLKEQGKNRFSKVFLDFGEDAQQKKKVSSADLPHSPYHRTREDVIKEDSKLKFNTGLHKSHLIGLIFILALVVTGLLTFRPLYQRYMAHQQSKEAYAVLKKSSLEIEQFVRQNQYFPDQLLPSLFPSGDAFYRLQLNQERQLILTFNEQAVEELQGQRLILNANDLPGVGLQWYCSTNSSYPSAYVPAACKTNK